MTWSLDSNHAQFDKLTTRESLLLVEDVMLEPPTPLLHTDGGVGPVHLASHPLVSCGSESDN